MPPARGLLVVVLLAAAGCSASDEPRAQERPPSASVAVTAPPAPTPSAAAPLAGQLIVLDPGHNRDNSKHPRETGRLVDAGGFRKACNTTGAATDAGVPEAQVAWELALETREQLERLGAEVLLTREHRGWGPCVDARATLANRRGAALLLSIHADGAPSSERGFHVIAPGVRAGWTDDIAERSGIAAGALRDALVAGGLTPSTYLGERGIDVRTDLGTLNHADVPAVIVECGNLRNAGDAELLTTPAGREQVAAGLVEGVRDFLQEQ